MTSSMASESVLSSARWTRRMPTRKGIGAQQKESRDWGTTGINMCCQLNGYKICPRAPASGPHNTHNSTRHTRHTCAE
jgi:hypothetical protein